MDDSNHIDRINVPSGWEKSIGGTVYDTIQLDADCDRQPPWGVDISFLERETVVACHAPNQSADQGFFDTPQEAISHAEGVAERIELSIQESP